MSASLVGSEMCIRDSLSRSFELVALVSVAGLGSGANNTATRSTHGLLGCLLYTSDAADDM
eukprot:115173-Alexandrium_andersonii.AAC.1